MTFTARLRRNAAIWTLWRQHSRTGGLVAGVRFRWTHGNDYVTGELAPAQVAALRGHADVLIETLAAPLPRLVSVLAPADTALPPLAIPVPAPEKPAPVPEKPTPAPADKAVPPPLAKPSAAEIAAARMARRKGG